MIYIEQYSGYIRFEDEISYIESNDIYVHEDDVREYYLDDNLADLDIYEQVDFNTLSHDRQWAIFKSWCEQEGLIPSHADSVSKFMEGV